MTEDDMPHDHTRNGWRAWLRAFAAHMRASAYAHAMAAMPAPSPAEVAAATRSTWYVAHINGAWHWRAQCGCVVEEGKHASLDNAEDAAQAVCMRLRRYSVQ